MTTKGEQQGFRLLGVATALLGLGLFGSVGCGNDAASTPSSGGSASGNPSSSAGSSSAGKAGAASTGGGDAGASTGGGSLAGGVANGGGGGSAGGSGGMSSGGSAGGTQASGAHCSPGTVLHWPEEVYEMFGGPLATCMNYQTSADGVPDSPELLVTDITLPEPLKAGSAYAFSTLVTAAPADGSVTVEFWGSDAQCGKGAEKLYSGAMRKGILCVELMATSPHEHLLMVWRGAGSLGATDVAICPGGACQ